MTGTAQEGWPLFPTYHASRLLFQTTRPGSEVVRVAPWADDDWRVEVPDQPEKELVAFADPRGPLTVMGLDTRGQLLNTAAEESPYYSIGGLPRHTTFTLAVWNGDGTGEASTERTLRTNAIGVARFQVPLQAAFALTTVPVA